MKFGNRRRNLGTGDVEASLNDLVPQRGRSAEVVVKKCWRRCAGGEAGAQRAGRYGEVCSLRGLDED
jgi:hypothetical protein